MVLKRFLVLFVAVVLLSGCVSSGTSEISNISSVEKDFNARKYMTKQEVVKIYGEPNYQFEKDGKMVYEYKYIQVKNKVLGYFPIIGMFFGREYKTNYLYTYFDKDDRLVMFDTVSVSGDFPIKDE